MLIDELRHFMKHQSISNTMFFWAVVPVSQHNISSVCSFSSQLVDKGQQVRPAVGIKKGIQPYKSPLRIKQKPAANPGSLQKMAEKLVYVSFY